MGTKSVTHGTIAAEAASAFENYERSEDDVIVVLRDDAPQWIRDAIYEAHSDFMPDDWRYKQIRNAFRTVADADPDDENGMCEAGDEFCDAATDIYTHDRLTWLSSNLNRAIYCDEYAAEMGTPGSDIVAMIGGGQYMEAREIWGSVAQTIDTRMADLAAA